jgi:tetratricopeptide (TPR) repeat protein
MFERSGAILMVAPRAIDPTPGMNVELDVLRRDGAHPPVFSISWHKENQNLTRDVGVFTNYLVPSPFQTDFSVAGETGARLAWLACTMGGIFERGAMGRDVYRQLSRSDALLYRISQQLRPSKIALERDPLAPAVLAEDATADSCAPLLAYWLGGPGHTADALTSGKPPTDVVGASKRVRHVLRGWCTLAQERFPSLAALPAESLFSLANAKMRLGETRAALADFDGALAAPGAERYRSSILVNRALAWSVLGFALKAIENYESALEDPALHPRLRLMVLRNCAIACSQAGKLDQAERHLEEILATHELDTELEALTLVSLAQLHTRAGAEQVAIDVYGRILELHKPPVEARLLALVNRGGLYSRLEQYERAIAECGEALDMAEISEHQRLLALCNRAYAKSRCGDAAGALADYERALASPELGADSRVHIEQQMAKLRAPE